MFDAGAIMAQKSNTWQGFLFDFRQRMANTFQYDVTTKLNRFMRHVSDHLIFLRCLGRGSGEKNKRGNKPFNEIYSHTNKHVE